MLALRARGTTIVLTTHYIEEAEKLADRVGFLHEGQLGRVAPRDELMSELGRRAISVELGAEPPEAALAALAGLQIERPEPRTIVASWGRGDEEVPDRVLRALVGAGCAIRDVRTAESSLESIFKEMVHAPRPARRSGGAR